MAEERRFQAPRLCVNDCGFFGSTATQDLCSKCYRDLQIKDQQSSSAKIALNKNFASSSSGDSVSVPVSSSVVDLPDICGKEEVETASAAPEVVEQPRRCLACKKRVGIAGFRCRCGMMLCGIHRYPEQHECTFDFKKMDREAIAKANPVVKGERLDKI